MMVKLSSCCDVGRQRNHVQSEMEAKGDGEEPGSGRGSCSPLSSPTHGTSHWVHRGGKGTPGPYASCSPPEQERAEWNTQKHDKELFPRARR